MDDVMGANGLYHVHAFVFIDSELSNSYSIAPQVKTESSGSTCPA